MKTDGTHGFQAKMADQIGFVVRDIGKVIKAWSSMFGMGPWTFRDSEGKDSEGRPWKVRVAYASVGPVEIELVQPVEGETPHSDFLKTHGEGMHHLGFLVDDVNKEVANFVAQGAKIILSSEGSFALLVGPESPGGLTFEFISREWIARRRRYLVQEWH